jgi:hypothetical protein
MECANKSVAATIITRAAQITLTSFLLNTAVLASPVKYEGYLVTDISLAGVFYHNAQVTIDFAGDTKNVHTLLQFPVQSDPTNTLNGGGAFIDRGVASVVIVANGRRISARLAANQIVVAVDTANGGIGFGAFVGPHGFEPAYPLGLSNGTVGFPGDPVSVLSTPITVSGNAWSCIGFPPASNNQQCSDPTPYPLKTDKGNLVLFNPYIYQNGSGVLSGFSGTLNRGFFAISPNASGGD